MDILYGGVALALWLAIWGLARGCEALRGPSGPRTSGGAGTAAATSSSGQAGGQS